MFSLGPKMTPRRTFRYLIATTWAMPLVAQLVSAVFYGHSGDAVVTSFKAGFVPDSPSWLQTSVGIFTLSLFVASIAVSLGLWFFQRWARIVYLPFGVFYVCWWLYGMPPPHLPITMADLATFITFGAQGAAVTMSFLPPVAALFGRGKPNHAMQPTPGRRTTITPTSPPAATRALASRS